MKKLICIFVCIMTLFGCSSKSNDKSNGQEDIIADETQENKDLAGTSLDNSNSDILDTANNEIIMDGADFTDAGSSDIINNYVDGELISGDFSKRGNVVTIDGKQYKILGVNGTQAEIMLMDFYKYITPDYRRYPVEATFKLNDGSSIIIPNAYDGSELDLAMSEFYDELPEVIQNSIVEQNIRQSLYDAIYDAENPDADFSGEAKQSGIKYYLTKKSKINVGTRKVYALDVDDVIDYLGSHPDGDEVRDMFFVNISRSISSAVLLRTASIKENFYGFKADCYQGYVVSTNDRGEVRPTFVLDLSLIDYDNVNKNLNVA